MSSPLLALKRALVGRPLATAQEHAQKLPKKLALPIFSSDAISSNAYATEEILLVLVTAGAVGLRLLVPITLAVALLLVVVSLSYRQTVYAYPSGGGAYIVGSENLGRIPGLTAGAALLVDYVMTVAVSVASGVAAITAAVPELHGHRVALALFFVAALAMANLRGLRESGRLFAVPTYSFIALCGGLIVVGLGRWFLGGLPPAAASGPVEATFDLTIFLVLKAFSGGCVAMTGVEAISNGVPVFKSPESKNASTTLGIMAFILGAFLLGISVLAHALQVVPREADTVLSQLGREVFGGGPLYFALQAATAAILVVAANTAFAGFPQLASILARDGFLPRQLANKGDRLVFSNGIVGLALVSAVLLVGFDARVHSLIPLYAVGVFTSFTISQAGMARHWWRLRGEKEGWSYRAVLNGFGATATGIVAVVVTTTKFVYGAWVVVLAVPIIVYVFQVIRRHYDGVSLALAPIPGAELARLRTALPAHAASTVVLFVAQVNEVVARSLYFARTLSTDQVRAVTIVGEGASSDELHEQWRHLASDVPLAVVESPYREFVRPAVAFVRGLHPSPEHMVVVVIPEFVVTHWWEALLHNQNALRLKGALFLVPWVVVVSIPFHLAERGLPPRR